MRGLRRAARWSGAALLALGLSGCGDTERPVWFAPNLASRDMVRLFTHPEQWRESRRDVGVFKFYAVQLGVLDACDGCGENVLASFAGADAFAKLRATRPSSRCLPRWAWQRAACRGCSGAIRMSSRAGSASASRWHAP